MLAKVAYFRMIGKNLLGWYSLAGPIRGRRRRSFCPREKILRRTCNEMVFVVSLKDTLRMEGDNQIA
jgi:hypothetical protein